MTKRLAAGALCLAAMLPGAAAAQHSEDTVPATMRTARTSMGDARPDRIMDGFGRGAAIGGLLALALGIAEIKSCDIGCDWGSTPGVLAGWAILGAGVGSGVGLAADWDVRDGAHPGRMPVTAGAAWTTTVPGSRSLSGRAAAPAFSAAVSLSPHISVRAEYMPVRARFSAAPGAIPDAVLHNVVAATTRVAGRSHGVESRDIAYVFSELVGLYLPAWGPVRVELLAGVGVQGEEERAYYDAHRRLPDGRTEPVPGRYSVLNFGSPATGFVGGADLDITLARGLSAAPTVRYTAMGQSATITWGVGVRWQF